MITEQSLNLWANFYAIKEVFEMQFGYVENWAIPSKHPYTLWKKENPHASLEDAKAYVKGLRK